MTLIPAEVIECPHHLSNISQKNTITQCHSLTLSVSSPQHRSHTKNLRVFPRFQDYCEVLYVGALDLFLHMHTYSRVLKSPPAYFCLCF